MKNHPKVIFFDVYQTLLDVKIKTEKSSGWGAFVKELEEYGLTVSADDFSDIFEKYRDNFYSTNRGKHRHHNMRVLIAEILEKDFSIKLSSEELLNVIYTYRKASRGWVHLYPYVFDTLFALSKKYILSVASYTQGSFTQLELRELGIERLFSHFVYSSDIGFLKESPDFYKHALKIVGKKAENCLMIGDNYNTDILVPGKIGVRGIWIKNPITSSQYPMKQYPSNTLDLKNFDKLQKKIDLVWH